jgi:Uma2 family endonuclease
MAAERSPFAPTVHEPLTSEEPSPRLFTVDEYYKMAEVGILAPDERVQLIEGEIIEMPPIGPRHAFNVDRLAELLHARLAERARIRSQNPIRLAPGAEPEPDVAVVKPHPAQPRVYASRHPGPDDALLIIEIADSTLSFDLGDKAAMYANHGVVELWVLDLLDDRLVVHREPTPSGYVNVRTVTRGESVSALAFPDVTFTADEILG